MRLAREKHAIISKFKINNFIQSLKSFIQIEYVYQLISKFKAFLLIYFVFIIDSVSIFFENNNNFPYSDASPSDPSSSVPSIYLQLCP
jgi:hypothetical protein